MLVHVGNLSVCVKICNFSPRKNWDTLHSFNLVVGLLHGFTQPIFILRSPREFFANAKITESHNLKNKLDDFSHYGHFKIAIVVFFYAMSDNELRSVRDTFIGTLRHPH